MRLVEILTSFFRNLTQPNPHPHEFSQLAEALNNQSQLLNVMLSKLVEGSSGQSQLLDTKFVQVLAGMDNQSELLNVKLSALVEGLSGQSQLLNTKFAQVVAGMDNQSELLNIKFSEVIRLLDHQSNVISEKLSPNALVELCARLLASAGSTSASPMHADGSVTSKIFCIGLGKTGTTSLEAFFKALGYKLGDPGAGALLLKDWAIRNFEPIIELARSAQVFQDIPFSLPFTFVLLDRAFPGSKFILSVRDNAEQWYRSLTRFHGNLIGKDGIPTGGDLEEYPCPYKGWILEAMQLCFGVSEQNPYDKPRLMKAYEDHNHAVTEYFRHRPQSFLTINLSDAEAVQKILGFLEIPYTGETMPHLNRSNLG